MDRIRTGEGNVRAVWVAGCGAPKKYQATPAGLVRQAHSTRSAAGAFEGNG